MPSAAWIDERHLPPLNLTNYWGYNPMAFLAPDPRLAPGGWAEIRAAVDALHAAGISVILDVVLNHSGESDEWGPTLSMRGLDNAGYYRLAADHSRYVNDAGCGNILAMDHPIAVRLGMDALRAWAVYGGLDGFRLDLAATLGRRESGFDRDAPFLTGGGAGPGPVALRDDRRTLGHRPGRLPARRLSRPAGASGTTATAIPCAGSGAAMPACWAISPPASPVRPTCSGRPPPGVAQHQLHHRA